LNNIALSTVKEEDRNMNTTGIIPVLICTIALVQTACVSRSTVQSRIVQYPDYFEKLSSKHKDLVRQNSVSEGMSKEAVYLAWGTADEVSKSSRNKQVTETWVYLRYEPIYSRNIGVGYGYGGYYGGRRRNCRYGGGGLYGSGVNYGTDVTYRSYVGAKVEFKNERVVSWETAQ